MTTTTQANPRRPYVIYTYPFQEDSGGALVLHLLCERLNAHGERAMLWNEERPYRFLPDANTPLKKILRYIALKLYGVKFALGHYKAPIATRADVRDAIVVYPEVIDGNPLDSQRVARWFLHQPGYHTGKTVYGEGELYFFYQDAFNDPTINPDAGNRLTLTYLSPVYTRTNFGEREGTCYLLRKGKDRAAGINFGDQLCVDDLTHAEKAAAFNKYKYLHSFDTYSMYSVFAAMCGCIAVIEPEKGVSREAWFPNEADRYGLAYGWDDTAWAERTQPALLEHLVSNRRAEDLTLERFVEKTQAFFAIPTSAAKRP